MDEEYQKYDLVFKEKREVAHDTYEFTFEKPKNFSFIPGQNVKLYFHDLDEEKKHRTLTIASAPYEEDLKVAMRIRESTFKKRLVAFKEGMVIEGVGPTGHKFFLHEDTSVPAVFIAGGIGVIPAFSIIKDVLKRNMPYTCVLFYSNRNEEDISYREELEALAKAHENFTLVLTLTNCEPEEWKGEVGYIDEDMITTYVKNIKDSMFYIAGAPKMMFGMKDTLLDMGVPEEHLVTKKFTGY